MSSSRLSDTFKPNMFFWKMCGIWPGRKTTRIYKYYSRIFLICTLYIYHTLLTASLLYVPAQVDLMIREVIFYFTEIACFTKAVTVLMKQEEIWKAFDILDCEHFKGDDDVGKEIIANHVQLYKKYWKLYNVLCHTAYLFLAIVPVVMHLIFKTKLELPICQYYFLSNEMREKYIGYLFAYQCFIYSHMMYAIWIDAFVTGSLIMAIGQVKVINHNLRNLKLQSKTAKLFTKEEDIFLTEKLKKCLQHHELVLQFCESSQKITTYVMFVQMGVSSAIICVVLCALLLPTTLGYVLFLLCYQTSMTSEVFVPSWFGTQLSYESQKLVTAAFNSDWVQSSNRFKRSIIIFSLRANVPIIMTGSKIFPLALTTFLGIAKTAYSFFTLVRNVQDRQG